MSLMRRERSPGIEFWVTPCIYRGLEYIYLHSVYFTNWSTLLRLSHYHLYITTSALKIKKTGNVESNVIGLQSDSPRIRILFISVIIETIILQ